MRAWNLMGGEIRWDALEIICTMLGISDPEKLILDLETIRNHYRAE